MLAPEPAWMAAFTAAVIDAHTDPDPHSTLLQAVTAALPEVEGAALCSTRAGKLVNVAASDDTAENFATAQRRTSQGPTVQILQDGTYVGSADVIVDPRWPTLRPLISRLPVRSVGCYPLRHALPRRVTLTLYAAQPAALDDLDVDLVTLVLAHTDIALAGLAQHARVVNLERALQTNEPISVAVGILITLNRYSEADALEAMAATSQAENRKLNDIAAEVVLTGALPLPPPAAATTHPRSPGSRRDPARASQQLIVT